MKTRKMIRTIKASDLTTMEKKVYNGFISIEKNEKFNREWVVSTIETGDKPVDKGSKITGYQSIARVAQLLKETGHDKKTASIKVYFSEECNERKIKLSLQGMGFNQQCKVAKVKAIRGATARKQNKKTTTAEKTNKILKANTKDSGTIEGLEQVFHKQNKEAQTMELIVLIKGSKIDGSLQQRLLEQFDVLVIDQADKLIELNVA